MTLGHRWSVGVVVLACSLAGLACSLNLGGPTPPASPIPVSTEAAGELEEIWQNAIENAQNGEVSVVMTEEQLTSYINLKLANDPDAPFSDVQVYLRDGQIQLYGTATLRGISSPATVILDVATTAEGRLAVSVAEADFGPIPVPQSMLDSLSDGLNELIVGQFGPEATGFRATDVAIADGQMAVTGTVTR